MILVWLYRLFPSNVRSVLIIQPETQIRWHRAGFRWFWHWKSRGRAGRPLIPADVRALVRRINPENPLWGAPRIHGELLKLGIIIAQSTVAKYMCRRHRPPSQGWRTFLNNHASGSAAINSIVLQTIGFKLVYALVILRLERRLLVLVNVTANPTAAWIARQITEALSWDQAPRYLLRDCDGVYGTIFKRRLRAMGIRDRPVAPRSPWHPSYVERPIGSFRRARLKQVVFLGELRLRRVLTEYANCYNATRTHLALGKDTPLCRPPMAFGHIHALPILDGLHHQYVRMA